jgi:hypothetical protein
MAHQMKGTSLAEYRKAALRHLASCQQLLQLAQDSSLDDENRERYLHECFYLSGYIYECSLKCMFYISLDRSKKSEIVVYSHIDDRVSQLTELLKKNGALDDTPQMIESKMSKHDIKQLNEWVRELDEFTEINSKLSSLAENWKPKYRYQRYYGLNSHELISLLEEAEQYMKILSKEL